MAGVEKVEAAMEGVEKAEAVKEEEVMVVAEEEVEARWVEGSVVAVRVVAEWRWRSRWRR